VVIGETGDRVEEYARRVGADFFQASEEAIERGARSIWRENRQWLERAYREGLEIIDLGLDPDRVGRRGRFYRAERLLLDLLRRGA
jgi:hypothetical protein